MLQERKRYKLLPRVKGKDILDCTKDDLRELIKNPDYRENEYLDYKETFSIISAPNERKQKEISEFRSDVCSFANSDGGYLLYGVREDGEGIAEELVGIDVENKDQFELNLKTYLNKILPRIPNYRTAFIKLENEKYVVVLYILHDYFAPYLHLADEKNYLIYKRAGNSKIVIPYMELRNMFTQSISLEKELELFRRDRIKYYKYENVLKKPEDEQFMIIHIIPEDFMNYSNKQNAFVLYRKDAFFSRLFGIVSKDYGCTPMVDGARVVNEDYEEIRLYNNMIAEYYYPLRCYQSIRMEESRFAYECHWRRISQFLQNYMESACKLLTDERLFVCVSIVGCTSSITNEDFESGTISRIDRDLCMITPIVYHDLNDQNELEKSTRELRLEYLFSLGISRGKEIDFLIKEVYG